MILGTGIDLVHVTSFADQLGDKKSSFAVATFTAAELSYSEQATSRRPAQHLAVRFAAKEAALKALDSACARVGITAAPIDLRELEVDRDARGRPSLRLHGAVETLAAQLGVDRAWISLSHDADYATAQVVLERLV
jgi:holo-[acyl-carrier protein] synthase